MLRIIQKGNLDKTRDFLKNAEKAMHSPIFDKYGNLGVAALANATPKETGLTASSWRYEVEQTSSGISLVWKNDNVVNGFNVAVGIQYGHGTRNGGYVQGIDYINPAMKPLFEKIADDLWEEVVKS